MDCFAEPVIRRPFAPTRWLAMTISNMVFHLLLLLLLLAGFQHPSFRQRNRFMQRVYIADMIGKNEDQRRVEIGALRLAQSAMGFDDGAIRIIRLGEIRAG
jgi:hypothetical protein